MYFQDLILSLQAFWAKKGCIITQGYDLEVGAGTMAPMTFLRALGPEPWNVAYVQPSRRPADGRERICMYLQGVENVFDIEWVKGVRYREIFHANEVEMSRYAFHESDKDQLFALFESYEKECKRLLDRDVPLPAYDFALKCSH